MSSANALRAQIEAALAERIPSALTPVPRMVRPVMSTGVGAVDELIEGGLPVGALTEMVGAECSGRTSLALKFVAQVTGAEKVCAWVDVSDGLSPESAAACGVDLARMLWVRCGVVLKPTSQMRDPSAGSGQVVGHPELRRNGFEVPKKYFVAKPVVKGLHGGGMGGHPRGEAKGMDAAVGGLLGQSFAQRCAEPQRGRVEENDRRDMDLRGPGLKRLRRGDEDRTAGSREVEGQGKLPLAAHSWGESFAGKWQSDKRPWGRIEQALKVTDLLLQAGGFGAIVLDMGGLAAEHVSRIPLATWFRYRAGAERTQACVLLLTQHTCAKSAAGLVLRMANGAAVTVGDTVLAGFERRVEVSRQRFVEEEKVVSIRKPPQRAGGAMWHSGTAWAGR